MGSIGSWWGQRNGLQLLKDFCFKEIALVEEGGGAGRRLKKQQQFSVLTPSRLHSYLLCDYPIGCCPAFSLYDHLCLLVSSLQSGVEYLLTQISRYFGGSFYSQNLCF